MKAIILAAGQGTRLRPLTDNYPKCMVQYQGFPIISHILESLQKCGIEEFVIVGGYRADVLDWVVDEYNAKMVVNADFENTNMVHSLFCAEDELEGDVLISYADIIYQPHIPQSLINSPSELAIAIDTNWRALWQKRMPDPLLDAETMILDSDGYVTDLGRKPSSYDEIQGQYMGLIKIAEATVRQVRQLYHSLDRSAFYDGKKFNQMYMTTFLREMIRASIRCKAVPTHGGWLEIDSPSDLDICAL